MVWPMKFKKEFLPEVMPMACPITPSLEVLGRKWAFPVLRDIAYFEDVRFSDILRHNPGLTPRVLVFRLKELQKEGFIERVVRIGEEGNQVTYELTPKGQDALPILGALTHFGMRHYAPRVFPDGKARNIDTAMPGAQDAVMGDLVNYARGRPMSPLPRRRGSAQRAR
jgi:DNA-binding HxlR family transcriptional regulator